MSDAQSTMNAATENAKAAAENAKAAAETTKKAVKSAVEKSRDELENTLDAIEDKFNVKKRASEAKDVALRSYDENPVPWLIGAAAAVVTIGGIVVWALFGDD